MHVSSGHALIRTRVLTNAKRRNIGVKPGSSETLSRLEGGCKDSVPNPAVSHPNSLNRVH